MLFEQLFDYAVSITKKDVTRKNTFIQVTNIPEHEAIGAIVELWKMCQWLYFGFVRDCKKGSFPDSCYDNDANRRKVSRTISYAIHCGLIEGIIRKMYLNAITDLEKYILLERVGDKHKIDLGAREREFTHILGFRNKVAAHTIYSDPRKDDNASDELASLCALLSHGWTNNDPLSFYTGSMLPVKENLRRSLCPLSLGCLPESQGSGTPLGFLLRALFLFFLSMNHRVSPQREPHPAALSRLAEDITAQVLAALREGVCPWQQPWDSGAIPAGQDGMPRRHTGERYAGINVLLLWMAAQSRGYLSSVWMTYRQAKAYGGQVRRGEHGTVVVYADRFVKTVRDEASGEEAERSIPLLKTYVVFNSEQIEGLPERFWPAPPVPLTPEQEAGRVAAVETFFAGSGAVIRHHGDVPCYIPAFDEIRLPAPAAFRSAQSYYATLAHELVHWTRAPGRLNRDLGRKAWGDAGYALEELVALS